jgi:Ca2+/Na+ antiporter
MTRFSTGNGFPDVVVTGVAMTTALATDYAISNSFGFGGHNVALAFGRYQGVHRYTPAASKSG